MSSTEEKPAKKAKKVSLAVIYTTTGWEELAIAERFGVTLEEAAARRTVAARVALFLDRKRSGTSDADAYREVMDLSLDKVADLIDTGEDEDPLEPTPAP